MLEQINEFFGIFVSYLAPILFMQINGFPLIVLVLLFGALIFTFIFALLMLEVLSTLLILLRVSMTILMI